MLLSKETICNQIIYNYMVSSIYKYFSKTSIWPLDGTLTGTIPVPSGPGSNDNEKILHTSQIFRTWASPSDVVQYHTLDTPFWGILSKRYSQCILGQGAFVFHSFNENQLLQVSNNYQKKKKLRMTKSTDFLINRCVYTAMIKLM